MALPIAERWFERRRVDDDITLLWEPHVIELMRCNIWHVRGTERDLVVDTGMGVVSLVEELLDLLDKPVTAVATHGHADHIGSHHEFDEVVAHPKEADRLTHPNLRSLDIAEAWGEGALEWLRQSGYATDSENFVTALPVGVSFEAFAQRSATVTRVVDESDVVDIGNRQFEVLHLPGHSAGSIGLWESDTGTLFSGDAIYDGTLLDDGDDSDIEAYCATMERLMSLPVVVVHGGHDPSFGRERLRQIASGYLARRS